MASHISADQAQPGDALLVIHEFNARSPDELSLKRGDRIELIERDDEFGDGWYLGRHLQNGCTGLFPEVYTQPARSSSGSSSSNSSSRRLDKDQRQSTSPLQSEASASSPSPAISTPHHPATALMALSSLAAFNSGQRILSGEQRSPVMNETLSVIDEHLTDINSPRGSAMPDLRRSNDSSSEYSGHTEQRLSYIAGRETDEEENALPSLREIGRWTPIRVAEWLEDVGVDRRHCDVFREQEISGEVLLGMDQASIFMKEFDLGPIGPRLKIWQKIKSLQQGATDAGRNAQLVPPHRASESASTSSSLRHRSTSIGTALPRIPSLSESNGTRSPGRGLSGRGASHSTVESVPSSPSVFSGDGSIRRPSAASVREMNHHRRHSSIEFANMPTPSKGMAPAELKKQPFSDGIWTSADADAQTRSRTPDPSGDPRGHVLAVATPDLDRGYFSGGELDNRKQRNVLCKGHSPSQSRMSSHAGDGRRASTFRRHSRLENNDFVRDVPDPAGARRSHSARTASGLDLWPSVQQPGGKEPFATVAKLEYGTPSIDAIASSPSLPDGDGATGRASPPPAIQRFPKQRATGLRAISDALAGSLSGSKNIPASPGRDSALHSPVRTGSSTPSQTSKSFDSGESPPDALRNGASGGGLRRRRAKSKKQTSAYQRGLEVKPPSESIAGSDYNGWMKKRSSNVMTTWKARLFVLKGRRLSYYYSEGDEGEKGLIDISGHRVLPANGERITGLHATLTGAKSSPTSPHNASLPTSAATDAARDAVPDDGASGMFIFKLVPPRIGLSKAVNFTKPAVHYFAVDNLQQGRAWMAALMKATIDRDETKDVVSTYQQKTISLDKAQRMQQRPPALMGDDEPNNADPGKIVKADDANGRVAISGLDDAKKVNGDDSDSPKQSGSTPASETKLADAASKDGDGANEA